jgi:hypothetical protein
MGSFGLQSRVIHNKKHELHVQVLLVKLRTFYSECFSLHHGYPNAARGLPAARGHICKLWIYVL